MLSPRSLLPLLFLISAHLSFGATQRAASNQADSSKEFATLVDAFAGYFADLNSAEGPAKAREQVASALESFGKARALPNPLKQVATLEAAVWKAQDRQLKGLRPGKIIEVNEPGGSFGKAGLDFAFRLPRNFEGKGEMHPLILTLPAAGKKPAEHLRSAWTHQEVLSAAILVCPSMPADTKAWDQTMVGGQPGGLSHLFTVLRLATERFPVDPNRVFVVARGAGVPAAFAAGKYSPHQFAGIVGIAGGPKSVGPENFKSLPSVIFGGGADATEFHEKSQTMGYKLSSLEVGGGEGAAWKWMQAQERIPHPEKLAVFTGEAVIFNPSSNRVNWLRVAPIETGAFANAEVNRAENSLKIDSTGISHATLYLSDALVDLDRPIKVIANGVTTHHTARRSVRSMLGFLAEGTSDPGCVYTGQIVVDVTGKSADEPQAMTGAVAPDFLDAVSKANGLSSELWALNQRYEDEGRMEAAKAVLKILLRKDPNHGGARRTLGHVLHGERWFTSQSALDHFLWTQDEAIARAKGHVLHKGVWMHRDERAIANKVQSKDPETGQWLDREEQERLTQGWVRQDLEWIEPEQVTQVDAGLWLTDGEWVSLDEANRRHSRMDNMWVIPGAEIWIHSSADRSVALQAQQHMTRALWDMRRVFGFEPVLPLEVAILRDQEQYDRFAFGAVDGRRPAFHAGRTQVIHHAYFAESRFVREGRRQVFAGMGVGYWEAQSEYGSLYGVHSARLAAGLAYVEGIDPSPKAIRKVKGSKGVDSEYYERYRSEKQLPDWLRMGGAVFAERYFFDKTVDTTVNTEPAPDPFWARTWSLQNLAGRGKVRDLDELFAFELDPEDPFDGQTLLIEAGLLVSFMLDGNCEPVKEAHLAFRQALAEGRMKPSHITALTKAIRDNESALRTYAGE
ncbi:MAG: hypothetical protein P1V35_03455 [Planctomycetota bacterium]|nr:hypothetical protein [Planctomycetota bacterium]